MRPDFDGYYQGPPGMGIGGPPGMPPGAAGGLNMGPGILPRRSLVFDLPLHLEAAPANLVNQYADEILLLQAVYQWGLHFRG